MKKILVVLCLCLVGFGAYYVITQPRRKENRMWEKALRAASERAEKTREASKRELIDLLEETL